MREAPVSGIMRRFLDRPSTAWVAGVALPVAMVALDPAVFRSGAPGLGGPILGPFKPLGYVGIAAGVGAMAWHLLLGRAPAVIAGVLGAASVFAAALGMVLLPFSLLGTFFFGVGLLGLSPFASSLVVGWWARRAYRDAPASHRRLRVLAGFLAFGGACAGAQWAASSALERAIHELRSGQPELARSGTARLSRWRVVVDLDQLVTIWIREEDVTRKESLAAAYRQLAGRDIEARAAELVD
jgi:hypothetical protein